MNVPPNGTYEGQLAARAAELLGELGTDGRLELLGVMDPDDLRTSLAFIASRYPQVFDFALVRDRRLAGRLSARLDEDQDDDEEPYCTTCGATVGVFRAHGDAWLHYTGAGTAASPVRLFDPGHEPVIAWRPVVLPADQDAPKPPGLDCDCGRRLPWPARVQDETCPDCGAVWEHDGAGLGAGARLKQPGRLPGEPVQDDTGAAAIVRRAIETGETVIVEDDEAEPRATPEERLLLAIYGADPGDADNVRELRKHAVTCTRDDHACCLAYLSGITGDVGGDEDDERCSRCRAVSWGQTPDGRDECTRCGWAEPQLVTPQPGRLPARPTPSTLVDRLVEDAHDDSPCPVVGLVVGQVDEDTLEVLWGERRFEEPRRPGTYEPFDALRPARDGAR